MNPTADKLADNYVLPEINHDAQVDRLISDIPPIHSTPTILSGMLVYFPVYQSASNRLRHMQRQARS
jgi:hypothetical protein